MTNYTDDRELNHRLLPDSRLRYDAFDSKTKH